MLSNHLISTCEIQPVKLSLNIEITYNPNLVPEEVLRCVLDRAAMHLADAGLFTAETDAEVKEWKHVVFRIY